mmetsp:Transcript_43758/g.115580  ORF Transcript_43758/g.115580 Transcript_43758/m.115580 type:complete len:796 (-) Transcript_43758:241-2628(-)
MAVVRGAADSKLVKDCVENVTRSVTTQLDLVGCCLNLLPESKRMKSLSESAVRDLSNAVKEFGERMNEAIGSSSTVSPRETDVRASRRISSWKDPNTPETFFQKIQEKPKEPAWVAKFDEASIDVDEDSDDDEKDLLFPLGSAKKEDEIIVESPRVEWRKSLSRHEHVDRLLDFEVGAFEVGNLRLEELERLQSICAYGVLSPMHPVKRRWDFAVATVIAVDLMFLPFQLAFKPQRDEFDMMWMWTTTLLFLADMCLNFMSGYIAGPDDTLAEPGTLVTRKILIARHYLQKGFALDLACTLPWWQIGEIVTGLQRGFTIEFVNLLRIFRLLRMLRLAKLIKIWLLVETNMPSVLAMKCVVVVKVLCAIVFICHWNACLFWIVGKPDSFTPKMFSDALEWDDMPHWTTVPRSCGTDGCEPWTYAERPIYEQYIFCFYWTLGVMRTMPAEVTPVNLVERVYTMIFMFFAFSAFAISCATIVQAFMAVNERHDTFNSGLAAVRMHLKGMDAPSSLRNDIITYLKHLYQKRQILNKEGVFMDQLPSALHSRVKEAKIMPFLMKLKALESVTPDFLGLVLGITSVTCMVPGDIVSVAGEPAEATWVVMTGRLLRVSSAQSGDDAGHVEIVDSQCLAHEGSVTSDYTVGVVLISDLLRIGKSDFDSLTSMSTKAQEKCAINYMGMRRPSIGFHDLDGRRRLGTRKFSTDLSDDEDSQLEWSRKFSSKFIAPEERQERRLTLVDVIQAPITGTFARGMRAINNAVPTSAASGVSDDSSRAVGVRSSYGSVSPHWPPRIPFLK